MYLSDPTSSLFDPYCCQKTIFIILEKIKIKISWKMRIFILMHGFVVLDRNLSKILFFISF